MTDRASSHVRVAEPCRFAQTKIAVPTAASAHIIEASDATPPPSPDRTKLLSAPTAIMAKPWRDAAAPAIVGNGETAPAMAFGIKIPIAISQIHLRH
jgi:hypothetical protein